MLKSRRAKSLFIVWGLFGLCAALIWPALGLLVSLAYRTIPSQIPLWAAAVFLAHVLLTISLFCLGITLSFFKQDLKEKGVFNFSVLVGLGLLIVFVAVIFLLVSLP